MSSHPHIRTSADVVAQKLGDDYVLLHLGTDRIYTLNRTGARLWELLDAGYDRVAAHEQMLREFEVSPDQLAREIEEAMASLLDEGLVTVHQGE
jgi:Coenzyme PQQ synthesis protein D (PqqD)